MSLRIVTDSTCDLPHDVVQAYGITVVPLFINFFDQGFLDGVEISRQEFYRRLVESNPLPTTGTPGLDAFTNIYNELASEGATQILSIHISKNLSATIDVAERAAKEFDQIEVTVRDSRQLSAGTGFQVETAARMAAEGKTLDEIIETLDDLAGRTFVAACLETLEYLRRSGRMNAFMAGLGSLLQIKPILVMKDGTPGSERVRTASRAEARLVQMLEEHQPLERFVLLHTNAPDKAEAFRNRIMHLIPQGEIDSMDITPVIGTHIGPGAVGYAIVTKAAS